MTWPDYPPPPYPNATYNGITVTGISKAVQHNLTHPPKVNIERATAVCLNFLNFSPILGFFCFFKEMAVACSIFTLGGLVQLFWTDFDMPVTGELLGWGSLNFKTHILMLISCIENKYSLA